MRYPTTEDTWVLLRFTTGDTVTIALTDLADDSAVTLDDDSCSEIDTSGDFKWSTSNITTPPTTKKEYRYVMTNQNGVTQRGKLVFGGYVDAITEARLAELDAANMPADIDGLITSVGALPAAVWATDISAITNEDLAGGALNWTYRGLYHKQWIDFSTGRLNLYNAAGDAVIGYWPLLDGDGSPVLKLVGAPARRGVFV